MYHCSLPFKLRPKQQADCSLISNHLLLKTKKSLFPQFLLTVAWLSGHPGAPAPPPVAAARGGGAEGWSRRQSGGAQSASWGPRRRLR